jgi:hypothetical protein
MKVDMAIPVYKLLGISTNLSARCDCGSLRDVSKDNMMLLICELILNARYSSGLTTVNKCLTVF